jgi:hypothetical protein
MPRPQSPEGKRVTICAKVTEADALVIDSRCAALGITRSAWLQSLIATSLAGVSDGGEVLGIKLTVDPQMPAGTAALASPGRRPVPFAVADCPHRGLKGGAWCKTCASMAPERRKG